MAGLFLDQFRKCLEITFALRQCLMLHAEPVLKYLSALIIIEKSGFYIKFLNSMHFSIITFTLEIENN